MSNPRAVTLDAAGTLIQVRSPVGETYARLAADHGIEVTAQSVSRAFRTVFPRMSPLAFGASDTATLARQERDWWRTLVRNCLGTQGQHAAFSAYFDDLYAFYADPAAWHVYPEVTTLLDALEAAGVHTAVVSNFDSRLHGILDGLGLAGRFATVLCSSIAGAAKPDGRIFRSACESLGQPPERVLHVGDNRKADLHGALAAGMDALWVTRDGVPAGEARAIPDLSVVPRHLADHR